MSRYGDSVYCGGDPVKGHMMKLCGLREPALMLCWPVGQGTKALLPDITLRPPLFILQVKPETL